jgi:hypothetical protein
MDFSRGPKVNIPNMFILGAAKAGTTTLYNLLKQHPQVFLSFDKEPMFFSRDDYYSRGIEWYIDTFFKNSGEFTIRSEATPHYLYWAKKVSARIHAVYASQPMKFLVILRNPIQRAYSWYWNMVSEGRESLSFLDALLAEERRIRENWRELEYYGSMQYGYYHGGCYATQLQFFFDDFPPESFLILLQEDLMRDQKAIMIKTFEFLNINSEMVVEPIVSNPSAMPRSRILHNMIRNPSLLKNVVKKIFPAEFLHKIKSEFFTINMKRFQYPEMGSKEYIYLREKFALEITKLSNLIGRDLSDW